MEDNSKSSNTFLTEFLTRPIILSLKVFTDSLSNEVSYTFDNVRDTMR